MTIATKNKISLDYLQKIGNSFLKINYGLELKQPIRINNRLRNALGRFIHYLDGDKNKCYVELAGKTFNYGTEEIILDVLKHELIHYALYMLNKPHYDGHPIFENELKKHNVSSTNTISDLGEFYKLRCNSCNYEWLTSKKRVVTHAHEYVSKCCNSKITYIDKVVKNGKYVK